MAKKISQLTQATEVKSDDVTVIVQDGETKKLPLNTLVTKQDIENKKVAGLAKLDEIEATYENDTYTPTITVKNKSSVKTGEGDEVDYSANVMDGHAKSAILSGNTLVNLMTNPTSAGVIYKQGGGAIQVKVYDNNKGGMITFVNGVRQCLSIRFSKLNVKVGSKYLLELDCYNGTSNDLNLFISNTGYGSTGVESTFLTEPIQSKESKHIKAVFTMTEDLKLGHNLYASSVDDEYFEFDNVRIIEYQEGMENWNIPYFTGMSSVKMPVLTTIGKNLFSSNEAYQLELSVVGNEMINISEFCENFIGKTFEHGIAFRAKITKENLVGTGNYHFGLDIKFICSDGTIVWSDFTTFNIGRLEDAKGQTFTFYNERLKNKTVVGVEQCHIFMRNMTGKFEMWDIEVYDSIKENLPTSYEPYKSNILSTPEDVTLRGIGKVQDTLDCLTGEVTERIGEIVLDGSENFKYNYNLGITQPNSTMIRVLLNNISNIAYKTLKNDKMPLITPRQAWGQDDYDDIGISSGTSANQGIDVRVWRKDLITDDLEGVKDYLSKNPITVQYQLATESIKTVDLMPSGTHPSTTPYCWKNGHIQLSSSGLLPNLEYSVVTSRAGQINQNATMIVKNDKRIFDLEILLAGGLVNTTYQALTLQNQVETGLSKVSLNSETEPDYLLYHMIMKLIEEKAYKLDDLTEKVSVFYLYEKLSDEQFETIYSALYPFVEDEIVEEPVVEELPEVVEDEVIM